MSLSRCLISKPLDDPLLVTVSFELEQSQPNRLNGFKGFYPQQVSLQGSDETLGTTVALRLTNEGGRGDHPQEFKLILKGIGHIL